MATSGGRTLFEKGLTFGKPPGVGIGVDIAAPTFPWADLLGGVRYDPEAGANRPDFNIYRGGIKQFQYAVNDQSYFEFHMPHDHVPGSNIFIHVHWSHISTGVTSGGVTRGFEASYAKGHNGGAFDTPVTTSVTQAASITQYQHMIAETQLSAPAGAGGLLNTDLLEPDGVILVRTFLSANNIAAATSPFVHYCDIHYRSTGIGTKQKAPNFYI